MTLVPIPTTADIDGMSSVLGVRQTSDSRALPNLLAFAKAFNAAGHGLLHITEASRSRPRQTLIWGQWEAYLARGKTPPIANLAAVPFTSIHDEVTHGNAVDLGSGIATYGTAAQQWAAEHGPTYGVHPTGLSFIVREPWHFDVDLITAPASTATQKITSTPTTPQENLMRVIRQASAGATGYGLVAVVGELTFQTSNTPNVQNEWGRIWLGTSGANDPVTQAEFKDALVFVNQRRQMNNLPALPLPF